MAARFACIGRIALSVGLLVACSNVAIAGPDVVVADILPGSLNNASKLGTINGVSGYALGTVSCNIGNADAIWIDVAGGGHTANSHPVIGQQLYRLFNGRFEQIGMSWLKHGFCAADAPSCVNLTTPPGVYTPNGSCDWLGLFATDTYGAGLQSNQSGLGPRSEVNGWTGVYPYPYVLGQGTGNCIYKMLQVHNSDLNPAAYPGAQYFVEVVYITSDEASAQRYNNGSYKPVSVGPLTPGAGACAATGYELALAGPVVPMKSAIEAWHTADPYNASTNPQGVILVVADVPNDGRLQIACKVTNYGNGTWHYEYAVFNMNSDRSVGSFSVPRSTAPSSTFTTAVIDYFHAPEYHSGEPYYLTPWTVSTSGANVVWSTDSFASNAYANAIRWNTLYNFRFDANVPPVSGSVTLGLFKPLAGDPDTLAVAGLLVPSTPSCRADFNGDGTVNVNDIFAFIGAWFAQNGLTGPGHTADFNGDGTVNVNDIFAFLAVWFAGCP